GLVELGHRDLLAVPRHHVAGPAVRLTIAEEVPEGLLGQRHVDVGEGDRPVLLGRHGCAPPAGSAGTATVSRVSERRPSRSVSTARTSPSGMLPRLTSLPNSPMSQACCVRRGASNRTRSTPTSPTTASTTSRRTRPSGSNRPTVPLARPSVTTQA